MSTVRERGDESWREGRGWGGGGCVWWWGELGEGGGMMCGAGSGNVWCGRRGTVRGGGMGRVGEG